jgi:hypothetical protein
MTRFNRRHILGQFGLLAGASALGLVSPAGVQQAIAVPQPTPADKQPNLNGTFYLVGENATLLPGAQGLSREESSVITALDMATGHTKTSILPVKRGHIALALPTGNIFVVGHHSPTNAFLDGDLNILKVITAPQGYVYSGHGMTDAERNRVIVPLRHEKPLTVKDTGLFEVYKLDTLELEKTVSTHGLHPHEPRLIPGRREIAVTHYGEIYVDSLPLLMNVIEPKLTIFDADTLDVKRHYVQPYNAMLTHMDVDDKGQAYCLQTQALRIDDRNRPWEAAVMEADQQMQALLGFQRDFPLPYRIADRKRIDVPLPIVQIDTQTGASQLHFVGHAHHMRGHSIAKNSQTGMAFAAYYHSDTVIVHKQGQEQAFGLKAGDLGITDVSGICELPGTPYMALSGHFRGLTVFDSRTFEIVRRYNIDAHEAIHLAVKMA